MEKCLPEKVSHHPWKKGVLTVETDEARQKRSFKETEVVVSTLLKEILVKLDHLCQGRKFKKKNIFENRGNILLIVPLFVAHI